MTAHSDNWYATTIEARPVYPAFEGGAEFDVIVIGGGLAGLTVALELARRGKSVGLFEAREIAYGASGRNGGFVSAGFAESIEKIAARVGPDDARSLMMLSQEGTEYIRSAIDKYGMQGVDPVPGWLNVQRFDDAPAMWQHAESSTERFGRPLDYWDIGQVRAKLSSECYFQGVYDAHAFHINPLNYALQLSDVAKGKGVSIFENSQVAVAQSHGAGFEITTSRGIARAEKVVVTGSAYLGRTFPSVRRAMLPVATHVVVSAPFVQAPGHAINFAGAVSDTRRAGDYYRLLSDNGSGRRLLWGGKITTRTTPPRNLIVATQADIANIYPQLGRIEMDHAWSGLMGYAVHKMPLIGEIRPGLWTCTAFGGHGLNTTAMGGLVVARAICGDDDRVKLFAPYFRRWGGGIFSRVLVQGAYWCMQARDRRDEN
jgi:gamma-glutamylputrescine oxidase